MSRWHYFKQWLWRLSLRFRRIKEGDELKGPDGTPCSAERSVPSDSKRLLADPTSYASYWDAVKDNHRGVLKDGGIFHIDDH